jgi:hypothetical protein
LFIITHRDEQIQDIGLTAEKNEYSALNIYRAVHRNNILLYKSKTRCNITEFILSDNCSTYFGYHYHPSSGEQTTVTTASGNRYTVIDRVKFTDEVYL